MASERPVRLTEADQLAAWRRLWAMLLAPVPDRRGTAAGPAPADETETRRPAVRRAD